MTTIRTYPNLFWLFINLFFLSFFGIIVFVGLESIFEFGIFFKIDSDNKIGMSFLIIFMSLFFLYYYFQLSNHFAFVKINSNEITIFQLMKFRIKTIQIEGIKGYSNSEISYGEVALSYQSKSIIFYLSDKKPIEIIKLFNSNFENLKANLKEYKITYFGKEPYETKNFKRKYKYLHIN